MANALYHTQSRMISTLAKRYPVIAIFGPRGNSKTHLVRSLFPSKDYIDLGNDTVCALARKSFKTFLLAFPQGAIINEADRIPEIVESVRYYVDKWGYEPGRYILVSSGCFDISALQDRGMAIQVLSPSVEELDKSAILTGNPFQYIHKGHLPKIMDGSRTYDDILENCFRKDFLRHINVSNREAFQAFLRVCAKASATAASMNSIAKALGISAPTVKTWLGILRTYHIVVMIPDTRREASAAKLFFTDSGLLCHLLDIRTKEDLILSPYKEQIVRSFALGELLKGRNAKALDMAMTTKDICDFKADWKMRYNILIEANVEITPDMLRRARTLATRERERKTLILYLGDVTYTQDGIDCIGYRDWTKIASGIDYFS